MNQAILHIVDQSYMDLDKIIEGCHQGNRQAQNKLYSYLYKELLHIPLRYASCKEEANEIFNNGMLKVFDTLMKSKRFSNFMGLAFTIIQRTAINHVRTSANYRKRHFSIESYQELDPISVDHQLNKLELDDLFKIIQSLPNAERLVFSLFEIDGYKHKEIAKKLDISEGNSKYILHSSKKMLRDLINSHYPNSKKNSNGL